MNHNQPTVIVDSGASVMPGMSFTIYQADGLKVVQWFKNVDELTASMLANPNDKYHRNSQ
jgi:hypothetical protein